MNTKFLKYLYTPLLFLVIRNLAFLNSNILLCFSGSKNDEEDELSIWGFKKTIRIFNWCIYMGKNNIVKIIVSNTMSPEPREYIQRQYEQWENNFMTTSVCVCVEIG